MPRSLFWDSAAMFIRYRIVFRAFRADTKSLRYSMNSNGTELEQVVHTLTSNIVEERLAERVWFSYSQSSLLNIYFRLREFQSSFLLIYFRYGPITFTLHQNVADKTCAIYDAPLSRSARRSYRNGAKITVRLCEQKPYQSGLTSGVVWT